MLRVTGSVPAAILGYICGCPEGVKRADIVLDIANNLDYECDLVDFAFSELLKSDYIYQNRAGAWYLSEVANGA